MAGAFFNILIPTKQHEIHLSQNITCDCSTNIKHLKKQSGDNTCYEKKANTYSSITMEKVSIDNLKQ